MGLNLHNDAGTLKLSKEAVMLEHASGFDQVDGLITREGDYSIYFDNIAVKNGSIIQTPTATNLSKGQILALHYASDSTTRTFTDTANWVNGMTWANYTKTAGSKIMLYWKVPTRNDSSSWGGAGINILYSVDGGTVWTSYASSRFCGGTMVTSAASIASQNGCQLMDITAITNATQIRIKFQHRPYDGTCTINGSHSITGGATSFGFSNITIKEIGQV